jgi:short-subunit dehydrogenase
MNGTAFITGASSGIGAAFARRLAREGYDLVLHGRREHLLDSLCDELRTGYRVRAAYVLGNLAVSSDLATVERRLRETQDLQILVNNAGYSTLRHFADEEIDGQTDMIQVHVAASVRLTHAALRLLRVRGSGAIINVSSVAGFLIAPGSVTYCATKAYLTSFTESLHLELRGSGIRVQTLCPGFTRSDFHERLGYDVSGDFFRGFMSAEQVVDASLRALRRGKVICIPGIRYKAAAVLPRFLPRRMLYVLVGLYRKTQTRRRDLLRLAAGKNNQA